ncbi:TPA: hypothetical protein MJE11_09105 [Klebsiella pneumoniae]|uniref:Uncharacterized protein n=1 Tax=Klebsiella pneumoniae TaxID=573 RepID=A0A5D3JM64_KLEPN|nr:hypothetical protein EGX99_14450 [Klebsiella pneumoniae]RUK93442.1 hypothetical protein ELQ14_26400 [Klebsiella pneumoniae subsp. pneumoniae]AZZ31592.1 hypothetical protein CY656_08840 [Klebsiella pneumoniae]EIW8569361.1 hypothetical protein [Klebsiella pneumoniae]KAA8874856.1 hypothetical protein F3Y16_04975 [Klebsiella pneumoniae]
MEHQSNDQHIRGSLNPALRNPLLLVVILVVLTESGFRFSLNISQLLAKAIPVRGAKFKKPAFEQAFCFSAPVLLPEGEWPPSGDCGFSVNSLPSDLSPAAPHKK